jgi:cell division protein FtsW
MPAIRRRATMLVGGVDPWLMLAFVGLVCIGLLMVYSASIADAYAYYGSALYVFKREVAYVILGLAALAVMTQINYHRVERFALLFFGASLVLLVAVLVPHFGHISHGARRWFSLGSGVELEPSELIKLATVIYFASWLTAKGERVRDFKAGFFPFGIIAALIAALILKQPDLGTTIVVVVTMFSIFFLAGADLKHLLAVGAGASVVAWGLAHSSYRTGRLTAFLDPWKDATGAGYHTIQVLLALGAGGPFGRGLGNSIQKDVLPAPHTDSILAVIGEEWGLVGTITVLLLFVIIAYRGLRIATNAPDGLGRLLAGGITCWITFQALMNFGVITSSVPFTGVPLPFVSYGGTSLIITMTAMGILLNISRHTSGESLARRDSDHGRRNGGTRIPGVVPHPAPERGRVLPSSVGGTVTRPGVECGSRQHRGSGAHPQRLTDPSVSRATSPTGVRR